MIIRSKGIAFSYIIRENDDPDFGEISTWDLKATLGTPHDGPSIAQDNLTVHNIILRNIADGSYAFKYVKPHIKKDTIRLDVKSLCKRYENSAMQEQYINEAKRKIESMT